MLDSRARDERMAAIAMAGIFALAVAFWSIIVFGLTGVATFIFRFAGIGFPAPWIFLVAAWAAQLALFPLIRRRADPGWACESVEGTNELVLVKPDRGSGRMYWYDQDHDFSFKRAYVGTFFAAAIAADEAIRFWRKGARVKRYDAEGIAHIAAYLAAKAERASLTELQKNLHGVDLSTALAQAAELPDFNVFSGDPQAITLTESAIEGILIRPSEVAE